MFDAIGRKIGVDGETEDYNTVYLITINQEHHMVHEGVHYSVQDYDADVDTGTPKYWHVIAPDTEARIHMTFSMSATGPGLIEFYESPTTTGDGTAITPTNNDRNSSNTSTMSAFYDPTVGADGTLLCPNIIGSEGLNPNGSTGGNAKRDTEWILKQDTAYLAKFTAFEDDIKISICMDFYEIPPKTADGS